jgi:hypothetical protein
MKKGPVPEPQPAVPHLLPLPRLNKLICAESNPLRQLAIPENSYLMDGRPMALGWTGHSLVFSKARQQHYTHFPQPFSQIRRE